MRILDKTEWGKYVSPLSDRGMPPFNWYSFKHRFGSELVSQLLNMCNIAKGSTVFDPFCGGGTTLIKSKLDGYNSVGLDISPFSIFLTEVMTTNFNADALRNTLGKISHKIKRSTEIPDVAILQKAFSDETLKYIYSLRDSIDELPNKERNFYLFVLLSILNDVSKAKKSGGFLRITDHRKVPYQIVKKKFIETANKYINNLSVYKFADTTCKLVLGDARNYPDEIKKIRYDAIITSPPYPNRHDYTRIYELELLVGFIQDNDTLKNLRYNTLRSHVEAKKIFDTNCYKKPRRLEKIINNLKEQKLNNPQIVATLEGYFEDMYLCLKEMSGSLKEEASLALVVSNVRFAGVMIPVDELLAELGEQAGLEFHGLYVLRYRGNSSQQMKEYKRSPSRESIIIWEK